MPRLKLLKVLEVSFWLALPVGNEGMNLQPLHWYIGGMIGDETSRKFPKGQLVLAKGSSKNMAIHHLCSSINPKDLAQMKSLKCASVTVPLALASLAFLCQTFFGPGTFRQK